jgi:hypothetical protein
MSPEFKQKKKKGEKGDGCLTPTHLLQSDEGSTKDGESMYLLEHSPADPIIRNTGQVSGEWVAKRWWERSSCLIDGGLGMWNVGIPRGITDYAPVCLQVY